MERRRDKSFARILTRVGVACKAETGWLGTITTRGEVVKTSSPPDASPTVQNSCTADAYKANLAKFEAIRSELSTKRTARTNRPDKRHLLRPISTLPLSKSEILSPGLPTEGNPKIEIHSDTASPSKAEVTELPKLQGPRKVLRAANKNFKI